MKSFGPLKKTNCVLFVSSYPPRECGIATFTQDLTAAFDKKFNPVIKTKICALNEQAASAYNYNRDVIYQINAAELDNYVSLAKKINSRNDIKLVNVQHEFGIFGGQRGHYLIPFVQTLTKPVVITFHSVLPRPDGYSKKIIRTLTAECRAVVVMNRLSQKILEKDYNIPQYKIAYIPHGIPEVAYEPSKNFKKELGFEGKIILSTFGLINENKGIEYAIRALPKVVRRFPNLIYLIVGETHPNVRKKQGEKYRNFLNNEVNRLGLKDHVKFYNKYISIEEIIHFLKATDIYISPSLDKSQSVSGTLSYALGCGRAVISTATEYAKHIINKKNGVLVHFKNPKEIARGLTRLISDEKFTRGLAARAYRDTRPMIWPNVAESYFKLYKKFTKLEAEKNKLPEIKFDHIIKLTDDFGIIQHARYGEPKKRFGYSLDDIARALIACATRYKNQPSEQLMKMMNIYLGFMKFAKRKNGTFANLVSYNKRRRDKTVEQDAQGRALWALGYVLSQDYLPKELRNKALKLFQPAVFRPRGIKAPRSMAFAMMGLYFYLRAFPKNKKIKKIFKSFADQLAELYKTNACSGWHWFEGQLTYSNSRLPEALFYAYDLLKNKKYLKIAESSLAFLESITLGHNYYMPIGQKGWYFKNKRRSCFDQQPEDTAAMVETEILAYKITKDRKHLNNALKAFRWFLGENYLGLMVYNEATGGCHDGLEQYGLNLNQGAESTISYAMARLSFEDAEIKNKLT